MINYVCMYDCNLGLICVTNMSRRHHFDKWLAVASYLAPHYICTS